MKKLLLIALVSLFLFPATGFAAKFPNRAITMIVPYAAGGSIDVSARAMVPALSKELGVNVVVRNTTGGGGTIGTAELARAKADGYTIALLPPGPVFLQQYQRELPYDHTSFDYVGGAARYPVALMSGKRAGWTTWQEMYDDVKANPGKYIYGSVGPGTIPHIAAAIIFQTAGLDVRHMPSTDAATVLAAIAGGTNQFYADMPGHTRRHDLVPLLFLTAERVPEFPDVPTAREVGLDIPDLEVWQNILAPKGLPADVKEVLSEAVYRAAQDTSFAELAARLDLVPNPVLAEDLLKHSLESMENFRVVMEALGFTRK
jgi:tripartite-type tricarboxylate transporter receptor subunit TctC